MDQSIAFQLTFVVLWLLGMCGVIYLAYLNLRR